MMAPRPRREIPMTDLSVRKKLATYKPAHKVRIVSAASLFDGHDASINIMRRILQSMGAEVIHLGHNRSVEEIVTAALQEDAQGIAVSSYQGGHVEFFKYMLDLLRERGGEDIRVFGGGGGVIVPAEVKELHDYGVARLFSPEDGQSLGLQGMIGSILSATDVDLSKKGPATLDALADKDLNRRWRALSRLITALELGSADAGLHKKMLETAAAAKVPTLGITGTGGAGKSSLTDELVRRLRLDQDDALSIAVISIDPSRKKSGGALLGDRIRMNAINPWSKGPRVYMRSLATREAGNELSKALARRAGRVQVRGLRPRDRGDLGNRAGRHRHREAGGCEPLRDDPGIRRGEPAGEDRHARLRRFRRHQQVRPQGRGRCAARCRQAGAAKPPGFRPVPRRDAGLRHHGRALQRRWRDRALPGDPREAEGKGPCREGFPASRRRRRATAPTRRRSFRRSARATSRKSRRACAATRSARSSSRASPASASSLRKRNACSPSATTRSRAISRRRPPGRSIFSWPSVTRSSIRARRSSSRCGRRCARPTAATSTW